MGIQAMRDRTRGDAGYLACLAHTFTRSQALDLQRPPPMLVDDNTTLNILMVICRPEGLAVPFRSLARPLLELFRPYRHIIRLDVLRPPTFEHLYRVLSDTPNFYHVLHFNTQAVPRTGGSASGLLFEDATGEPRWITGEILGRQLALSSVPVVLVTACGGQMVYPEVFHPPLANQLLEAGVYGVVVMAYSALVQSVVRFMARLYEGLLNGEELAHAVTLTRAALRSSPQQDLAPVGEMPAYDWVGPVLLEATPVCLSTKSLAPLRLDVSRLPDQKIAVETEPERATGPTYGFVGRDDVILALERAFQTETIVLLAGMAGVGKTTTAEEFTRWWTETGGVDGPVFFFPFERHRSLRQICDLVGQMFNAVTRQQLGVDWHRLEAAKRRQVTLSLLRQVPCLMIWDSFEAVAGFPKGRLSEWTRDEQEELRDFLHDLRGGRSRVLITSRSDEEWLGALNRCEALDGLGPTEVQELAARVLTQAGLDPMHIGALPQYNALLKYLDGNPLAMQLTLPELTRLAPGALITALRAAEKRLGTNDLPYARARSLMAVLIYRLDTLEPITSRQRLGVLGLFQRFMNVGVLARLCAIDNAPEWIAGLKRQDWLSTLDAVATVGLLQRVEEGHYTVPPSLAWFFHDLLHETFAARRDWLECAFATIYGTLGRQWAQTFQTNPQRALSLLSAEENNLTHALHLARRHERWSDVQGILEGLKHLLTTQGRWVEWEQLLADVNTVVTDADGKPLSGREVLWVALLEHHQHIAHARRDFEAEETILRQLEEYYEHIEDNDQQAVALHNLGNIAFERHQFREAGRWYRQSMTIKECIGDVPGQAITLYQLGRIAEERRQFKEAGRWYQQSLTLEKRIRNASGQAMTLHRLGRIAEKRRQFAEAERWYRQSLAIKERLSDEQGQAMTLHQLGSIAEEQGQFVEAERCYHRAIAIFERLGDIDGHTNTRRRLERIVQQRGRAAEPLPGLVEALKSANADLRVAAARALGEVPPSSASQAAIDALKGAIQDADAEVRRAAAGALQRLLPQTLYEQLLSTIETARREGYNPYIAGGPVHEDRMFFGREAVLAAILNTIHNNSVLIYGERRIGKTSILHKLRRALQQRDDAPGAFFPVFVSLQGVSEGEFFATLVERILDVCPHPPGDTLRYYSGSTSYSYASFQRDMQRVTQYLVGTSPRPPKIVLLLDEVDTFNDYSLTTNLRLRDLFTGPLHPYFTAVMSGYALRETWPTQASPPFNYLSQRIKIEPLDAATARQLIEEPVRGWYRYETGAVGRILALSELRPFLIQKFCLEAVNRMLQQGRQQILLEDVEAAAVIVEALKASLHPQADGVKDLSPEQRRMVELEQANATLQARIAELEARLNTLAQRR